MMNQDTAVRIDITVNAPIDRAFTVFVDKIGTWWPRSHSVSRDLVDVVIEPRAGGRFYERSATGAEHDWGAVTEFDPPHRVVVSWAFTPDWELSDDPAQASRVAVEFTSTGPDTTAVTLVHSELQRHGAGWEEMRDSVAGAGGWTSILDFYAKSAN